MANIPTRPAAMPRGRSGSRGQRSRPAPAAAELLRRALVAEFTPAAALVDQRFEILSVQGPVVDYLEFPAGELTRDLLSMARPVLRTVIRDACRKALQGHHTVIDETARVRRQGTYVPCSVTARPIAGAGDEVLLMVTFQDHAVAQPEVMGTPAHATASEPAADLALVRQLEHELRATREDLEAAIGELELSNEALRASTSNQASRLYQQMIEHLPVGAVHREADRLTMNRAAEMITGYDAVELPTVDAWCSAVHGAQAAELRPRYDTSLSRERAAHTVSLAIARKDGQARHVELTVRRFDDTHELWMLVDMTEHDHAAQALRRSEDYLRSIVDTAADAIVTIDERAAIETFNPAAERMFGYTAAEVVGRNVRILMPPPYRDEHDGYIARYVKTGEARIIGIGREVVGLRKDGSTFPLDLAVSEIGHLGRFTGILRDLSDRRRLEWRLAESQLEERRHMARELHDEIGGHMTGIGLLAQTLHSELASAGSPLSARTEALVEGITDAHQRLRAVIRGLMPVETLPEGLMSALSSLASQCETAFGIPCRFQCEQPVHVGDPGTALHLFRITQEAVNNAVRHAQPTGITISLRERAQHLEIVVADDGRGLGEIPAGHSGIGLDNMRQRARLLGGDLSIQSPPGGGTVVTSWVPLPSKVAGGRAVRAGEGR